MNKFSAKTPYWTLRDEILKQDADKLGEWLSSHTPHELAAELLKSRGREAILVSCLQNIQECTSIEQAKMLVVQALRRL